MPQFNPDDVEAIKIDSPEIKSASENILEVGFSRFRDSVLSYLPLEEQSVYRSASLWDEIKLKVISFIEELQHSK